MAGSFSLGGNLQQILSSFLNPGVRACKNSFYCNSRTCSGNLIDLNVTQSHLKCSLVRGSASERSQFTSPLCARTGVALQSINGTCLPVSRPRHALIIAPQKWSQLVGWVSLSISICCVAGAALHAENSLIVAERKYGG